MERVPQALIGVGSNLGDRLSRLRTAASVLRATPGIQRFVASRIFETEPVGLTEQPAFLNAAFGVETTLKPEELLKILQSVEAKSGRIRVERWGPRTLDLDLLAFEGEQRATPELQLPHPRMLERSFVLVPLADVLGLAPFEGPTWASLRERAATASREGVRLFSAEVL